MAKTKNREQDRTKNRINNQSDSDVETFTAVLDGYDRGLIILSDNQHAALDLTISGLSIIHEYPEYPNGKSELVASEDQYIDAILPSSSKKQECMILNTPQFHPNYAIHQVNSADDRLFFPFRQNHNIGYKQPTNTPPSKGQKKQGEEKKPKTSYLSQLMTEKINARMSEKQQSRNPNVNILTAVQADLQKNPAKEKQLKRIAAFLLERESQPACPLSAKECVRSRKLKGKDRNEEEPHRKKIELNNILADKNKPQNEKVSVWSSPPTTSIRRKYEMKNKKVKLS